MGRPKFIQVPSFAPARLEPVLGADYPRLDAAATRAREEYEGRAIWHVNSTFRGGGVAEILHMLLPYVRGAGVDTRWLVLRERQAFFELTKRIHINLHGADGELGPLNAAERRIYGQTLAASAHHFARQVQPDDVVFLHDPQTAGLVPALKKTGARVIWRCHIGCDEPNEIALAAQRFLLPWVAEADNWVFSRESYIWEGLDPARTWTMAPSIDPLSPKNQDLSADTVAAIIGTIGLGRDSHRDTPRFTRADGTPGRVERAAEVLQVEPLPQAAKLVAQVSRWDRLKDPIGLVRCFEHHLADTELHLLLAGPATAAVADDPEGARIWAQVRSTWRELPDEIRRRVHLVSLPMADLEENGAMVNALQHRAQVVVQKSLAEGFGLTVAEAMWKRRAVVGSRVGGIQDQIVDGESGLLVAPEDLEAVAAAIRSLTEDPALARQLGRAARERVRQRFLAPIRLTEYLERLTGEPVAA